MISTVTIYTKASIHNLEPATPLKVDDDNEEDPDTAVDLGDNDDHEDKEMEMLLAMTSFRFMQTRTCPRRISTKVSRFQKHQFICLDLVVCHDSLHFTPYLKNILPCWMLLGGGKWRICSGNLLLL
jgi:hypothetical protein